MTSFANRQTADTAHVVQDPEAGNYVSGGAFTGATNETIHVEKGVHEMTVNWLSNQADSNLILTDPERNTYPYFTTGQDAEAFFEGAYHHTLTIHNPASGKWTLEASSAQKEHYLLNVSFASPLNAILSTALSSEDRNVTIKTHNLEFQTDVTIDYYKNGKLQLSDRKASQASQAFEVPDLGEGLYNMTMNIHGSYAQQPFRRTIIQSIYADAHGNLY